MSSYLGFEPTDKNTGFYFISYNNEDAQRLGKIISILSQNIPIWYDYGIEYGEKWEKIISEKIAECESVLLFFTKGILTKEESYVKKEYDIAKICGKRILVIIIDNIRNDELRKFPSKIPFWIELKEIQNIDFSQIDFSKEENHRKASCDIVDAILSKKNRVEGISKAEDVVSLSKEKKLKEEYVEFEGDVVDVLNELETYDIILSVDSGIIKPHKKKLFGFGFDSDEISAILSRLEELKKSLNKVLLMTNIESIVAYKCAQSVMTYVKMQLAEFSCWDYSAGKSISVFVKNYEPNIKKVERSIEKGEKYLSVDSRQLLRQIITGIEDIEKNLKG